MQQVKAITQFDPVHAGKADRFKGVWMVLTGAMLWGASGSAAQVLMQQYGFTAEWLVTMRMSVSGILLLLLVGATQGVGRVFSVWKNRTDGIHLIIFGFFGLLGVQYSYLAAIQYGNAAMATLLQYLGPALVTLYISIRLRKIPGFKQQIAVLLAFVGTGLLVTNGHLHGLSISTLEFIWGIISAFALAFYTIYPKKLIDRYGAAVIVGWAMFIGSILLLVTTPPWHMPGRSTVGSWLLVMFVVLFGTLIAFYLYMGSLRYVSPADASVLGCAEPLAAAAIGLLFLNVTFSPLGMLGGVCIVGTVIILARAG
jgi:drug/metabolite transporter (DMT)-like permease